MLRKTYRLLILLGIGGAVYYGLEILWRGRSHWTMFLVGGVCFVLCGLINELFTWDMPLLAQGAAGACLITATEFVSGLVLNVWLGLGIWDYSDLPLNIMGQVCLPFSLLWAALAIAAVILDDWLRYLLFHEEKPRYRLL